MPRWPSLALLALACTPATTRLRSPDEPGTRESTRPTIEHASLPEVVRPEPPSLPTDAPVWVEQYVIPGPSQWRFEPMGSRVAATLGDECGIWTLASDDHLGAVAGGAGSPCETWPSLEPFGLQGFEADRRTIAHGADELVLAGRRADLQGRRRLSARARRGLAYQSADFSPDGEQLALLAAAPLGPVEVEIWNLGTGRRTHVLAVEEETDDAAMVRAGVRWTPDALIVAREWNPTPDPEPRPETGEYGEYGEYRETSGTDWPETWVDATAWPLPDTKPIVLDLNGESHSWFEDLFIDPSERWLIASVQEIAGRDKSFENHVTAPIGGAPRLGLSWRVDIEQDVDASEWQVEDRVVRWADLVGSSFIELVGARYVDSGYYEGGYYEGGYGEGGGQVEQASRRRLAWFMTSLIAQPIPEQPIAITRTSGTLLDADYQRHAWDLVAAGRERLLANVDRCDETCVSERVEPPGCEVVDLDWTVTQLLLACGEHWKLAPLPPARTRDTDAAPATIVASERVLASVGRERAAWWGASGHLVLTTSEGLRVLSHGKVALELDGARLVQARLGEELDLALVVQDGQPRVLELRSDTLGVALAWAGAIEHAAFSPDRRHLALAGGGRLAVFSRGRSSPLVRWTAGTLAGLAYRQDGAVLFVGVERALPELALDPIEGELVEAAQFDRVTFERIAAAELDPSWRWAVEEDGTFLRTLDGEALTREGRTESGWFADERSWLGHRLRIGGDALGPVHDPASFTDQLERPALVSEFFGGSALPRPRIAAQPQ